jgi:hypothetical protein
MPLSICPLARANKRKESTKMDVLKRIVSSIKTWFNQPITSDIDTYITAKSPKTPGDVDYWLSRYYKERSTKFYGY